jgi:hypothetical protein
MTARSGDLLRIAFLAGAITDAGALLPMLSPRLADFIWGFRDVSGSYRFALGYGGSLMLGWILLLLWAYRSPFERRFVAPLTALVICGLVLTEVVAVHAGTVRTSRMVSPWSLQALLLVLFVGAYCSGSSGSGARPENG